MNRPLTLLAGLLVCISSGLLRAADPSPRTRPNIVFILADDAGIGDFSPYGCKYGSTPNIDQIGRAHV